MAWLIDRKIIKNVDNQLHVLVILSSKRGFAQFYIITFADDCQFNVFGFRNLTGTNQDFIGSCWYLGNSHRLLLLFAEKKQLYLIVYKKAYTFN